MTAEADQARGLIDGIGWYEEHALIAAVGGVGHAILALAEQQQVANRIALAQYELAVWGRPVIHEGYGVLLNPTDPNSDYKINPEIEEALR